MRETPSLPLSLPLQTTLEVAQIRIRVRVYPLSDVYLTPILPLPPSTTCLCLRALRLRPHVRRSKYVLKGDWPFLRCVALPTAADKGTNRVDT